MVPADQPFEPDDAPCRELDLRLIVELELVVLERPAQLVGDAHPLMHLLIEILLWKR